MSATLEVGLRLTELGELQLIIPYPYGYTTYALLQAG